MRRGVIAVVIISAFIGTTAPRSYGDIAYGVGDFMGFDAFSGVGVLDTTASTAGVFIHTPGLKWYGATDGLTPDTFFAVANPTYPTTPSSELFEINTTTWAVTSLGLITAPTGGGPIREIAYDENSGTLYGTDYANLYTIPVTGGPTAFVAGLKTPAGDVIDYVFAMDYVPSVGLVGTSWRRGDDQTDLYTFNTTTGVGTLKGYTGVDRTSDVWYSNDSGRLLGAARNNRILEIDAATGAATVTGTVADVSFYGLANATVNAPPAPAMMTVPLSNLGYTTYVSADVNSHVQIGAGAPDPAGSGADDDTVANGKAEVNVIVRGQVPGAAPWQETDALINMDLSSSPSVPAGMLRFSSDMDVIATGDDEGVADVTRNSTLLGTASVTGLLEVGTPAGQPVGTSVLFGAGVYLWGEGIDPFAWTLVIKDNADPSVVYLNVDETSAQWSFTFDVPAGQKLDYEFSYDGVLFQSPNGDYDLFADLDFGAAYQPVPEPASMILLSIGALSLVRRKRRVY